MQTRVQKWGNSLAVRIPKAFAEQVGLEENAPVALSLSGGKLIIAPASEDKLSLEDLLAAVTDENLHREWETGPAVGHEAW